MKNQKNLYWLCGDFWEVIRQSLKTDNTHDTGLLKQTTAVIWWLAPSFKLYYVFMLFLIFSNAYFPSTKRKYLIVVFFLLWFHCMYTVCSSPFHCFVSHSLLLHLWMRRKNRAEQSVGGQSDLERDWNSLRINDC